MQRKHSRPHPQLEPFDLRLAPTIDREYNALTDPHANYYFVSSAAKQRLKELKRSLRKEKHQKSTDEKQMLKLIKQKIKFHFPKIQLPLVNQKQLSAIIASSRQHSEHAIHRNHQQRHAGSVSRQEGHIGFFIKQGGKERLQTDAKKSISCNKAQKIGRSINHSEFVQFLAEKKSLLRENDNS